MLRKVEPSQMPTMDDRQARLLEHVAELDVKGRARAFDLLTVGHLKCVPKTDVAVTVLVTKLFAVIGLLPALRKLLLVTAPSPVVTPEQLEIISDSIQSCRSLLCKIDAVVCETDKHLLPTGGTPSVFNLHLTFLSRQEQQDAQDLLTTCFRDLVVIISAARAFHLERFGFLTDEQTLEGIRLREALAHPGYKQSPKGNPSDIASFGNWSPSYNQPSSTLGPQLQSMPGHRNVVAESPGVSSSPPLSSVVTPATTRRSTPVAANEENTTAATEEDQSELVDSFRVNLSFDGGEGNADEKPSHPSPTPVRAQPSPVTVALGANTTNFFESVDSQQSKISTPQSTADQLLEGRSTTQNSYAAAEDASKSSPTKPRSPAFHEISRTPTPTGMRKLDDGNLEAYIIRPLCENSYDAIEWSYKTQLLPLKNSEIENHMKTLGPDYSVISSVGDLLPEELRLVLIKVKIRSGHLLSVQRTRDVDLVTKMGTFKVQSIVFVLKTTKDSEIDTLKDYVPTATLPKTNLFGNPNPPQPFGGFGTGAGFGANSGFGAGTGFGTYIGNGHASGFGNGVSFGRPSNPFGGSFGNNTTQSGVGAGIFGPGSQKIPPHIGTDRPPYNPHIWEVDAAQYLTQIKNEGDVCQYIEYDHSRAPNGIQHFQAITFNPEYRNCSFEELRLLDQKEGRTGPRGAKSPVQPIAPTSSDRQEIKPTNVTPTQSNINAADLGGGGLFGGLPSSTGHQTLRDQKPQTQPPSTVWFGGFGSQPTTAPGAGLFGSTQPISSSGGLFGTFPNTSSNRDLFGRLKPLSNNYSPPPPFGNSQPSTSGGLFGHPPPSTNVPVVPLFGSAVSSQPLHSQPQQPSPFASNSSTSAQSVFGSAVTAQPIHSQQQRPSPFASNSATSSTQSAFGTIPTNNAGTLAQPGIGLFGSSYIPPRK